VGVAAGTLGVHPRGCYARTKNALRDKVVGVVWPQTIWKTLLWPGPALRQVGEYWGVNPFIGGPASEAARDPCSAKLERIYEPRMQKKGHFVGLEVRVLPLLGNFNRD